MIIYKEFDNGMMLAMADTSFTRAAPGSVFRFGKSSAVRPLIEIYQPNGASGLMAFGNETETSARAFLTGLGFIEARRYDEDQGNAPLKHTAKIIAPT